MKISSRFCPRRSIIFVAIGLTLALLLYGTSIIDADLLLLRVKQIDIGLEGRVQNWDFQDTAEEQYCRSPHQLYLKKAIPNVAHFIMLAPEGEESDLTYAKFLAIKSAVVRMKADEVKVHTYGLNTDNEWWQQLQDQVTIVPLDRDGIPGAHGLPLHDLQLAHQSDVLRLHILQREGGIYLDTDVYALRPFADLLTSPRDTLLGHEGGNRWGFCNAVILSRPRSAFLSRWQASYSTFDVRGWNEHSVQVPKRLQVQRENRELLCPLSPSVFFWPTWAVEHVWYMHEPVGTEREVEEMMGRMDRFGGAMYENQLAMHAWQAREYLHDLTPEQVRMVDSRFHLLVREIVDAQWPS